MGRQDYVYGVREIKGSRAERIRIFLTIGLRIWGERIASVLLRWVKQEART